jgi:septal ring factor EnvC (AmiA/AmiB activator)
MDEYKYLSARRNYHNAQSHLESLREKQRRSQKRIKHLNIELDQQQSKLQTIDEKLVQAVETLARAKEVYGPLRQQWKEEGAKSFAETGAKRTLN